MKRPTSGGGWPAILYTLKKARASGGIVRMLRALNSRNACKTCALGMGGQMGGMRNERGRFPEVCKKSVQAMAADMQGRIREGFFDRFSPDQLGRMTPRELEASGRLVEPLHAAAGSKHYRPIAWEEAISRVGAALRESPPDDTFFYFSGRSSNEAGFLLQLFARLYGTNNVNNCSYFCHQASGVGLASVTGSGTATVTLEDAEHADLLFLIGGNPASNHPRLMRTMIDLRRRGGKVIVINPLREIGLVNFRVPSDPRSLLFGSKIADEYLQPHIGGDIALLTGIAKSLLETGPSAVAEQFIADHTEGFGAFRARILATPWAHIESDSGIPLPDIHRIAGLYARSRNALFCWTMGITHHQHGVHNVRAIANLALLRGMLGRPGAGLLPLRGHSNVQGIGSMGAVPELKGATLAAIEEKLGLALPRTPGLDTLACIRRAGEGRVKVAVHLGGNLFGSCPDAAAAQAALAKIGLTVFLSTTLNTGHFGGRGRESLILPVLARDEDPQSTTQESMFNYVRLSDGGQPRHAGPRAEVATIAAVARAVLGESHPANFAAMEEHATIRTFIADTIPGYQPLADIDATKKEFHIAGRIFHEPTFATPSGRARFHDVPLPVVASEAIASLSSATAMSLRLMTIRSEGQFNTVVYEDHDLYRGQDRRDVILLNPADMARLNLKESEPVTIRSRAGEMTALARRAEIRAGNAAMYYPEANILVPADTDSESRTPAFKSVAITVSRSGNLPILA